MARRVPVDGLSLEALGLDAHETAAYLLLLEHPRATAAEIEDAMGLPARRTLRLSNVGADTTVGAAYLFRFDGANWVQEHTFLSSDGTTDDFSASRSTTTARPR